MTSVQQADQGVTQFTPEEKAAINEAMKEAQTLLENNNNDTNADQVATVAGAVSNSQNRSIMLYKTLDAPGLSGTFVVAPPTNVGGNASGAFVHRAAFLRPIPGGGGPGPVVTGCKAAVIYGTFDKLSLPPVGYLLAWFKSPSSDDEHKVYVEAGNLSKLMDMEWSDVEPKLDASNSKSRYVDSETGATAAAEIKYLGDKSDNLVLLGASFDSSQS